MKHLYKSIIFALLVVTIKNTYGDNQSCEVQRKWVVMVTVSEGYDEMFQNWLQWYRRLKLGMEIILVAEDQFIEDKYSKDDSLTVINHNFQEVPGIMNDGDLNAFNVLVARRSFYLLQLFKKYENIIYTDVDTVWLKDPRPYFVGDFDFWGQLDGVIDGTPYFKGFVPHFCTGFMALRSTAGTLKLLNEWFKELEQEMRQDQIIFNKEAFEASTNGRVLPMTHFPCGILYFKEMSENMKKDVVIIHNNFISGKANKIQRFMDNNLWMPDSKSATKNDDSDEEFYQNSNRDDFRYWNIPNMPGIQLLGESNLNDAFDRKSQVFKTDIMKFFIKATSHWLNPSMKLPKINPKECLKRP